MTNQQRGLVTGIGIFLGIVTGGIAQALDAGRWPSVAIAAVAGVVFTAIGWQIVERTSRSVSQSRS